jgi:hypothetical protein
MSAPKELSVHTEHPSYHPFLCLVSRAFVYQAASALAIVRSGGNAYSGCSCWMYDDGLSRGCYPWLDSMEQWRSIVFIGHSLRPSRLIDKKTTKVIRLEDSDVEHEDLVRPLDHPE